MQPSLLFLLHRAEQVADRLFHDSTLGFITPRQLAVLTTVSAREGCNLRTVVERTGIDRSTTTEVVRRLVGKGLLQKQRSRQDARNFMLKLTDGGRVVLADAVPITRK